MSHGATNWAIQQRGLKPTTKIVLWHLADRFNPDYGCFPSQDRLAHDCEISRATLNRHLDDLEARALIHRIRITDPATGRQRPTRYLLAFEAGFPPPASEAAPTPGSPDEGGSSGGSAADVPCPDVRHGTEPEKSPVGNGLQPGDAVSPCLSSRHGSVSHSDAIPCLKNGDSRVSKRDTNPVREPLREPVKAQAGAQACAAGVDDLLEDLLRALGFDPGGPLPGCWQGAPPRRHVRRWRDELALSDAAILTVAADTRRENPAPPVGPKALERAMERAARRNLGRGTPVRRLGESMCGRMSINSAPSGSTPSAKAVTAFYAELVNSDRFLPTSMISNTIRNAMLASGMVTAGRLRERGIA